MYKYNLKKTVFAVYKWKFRTDDEYFSLLYGNSESMPPDSKILKFLKGELFL